jgi:aspartokinase/homoserine dehydrogenase 1
MKVLKFGGSSVGNATTISKVLSIVKNSVNNNEDPIVVLSAFQGVTDLLVEAGKTAAERNDDYKVVLDKIIELHFNIIYEFISEDDTQDIKIQLNELFDELEKLLFGVYLIKELSFRSKDQLMSYGEQFSAMIVTKLLCSIGLKAEYIDAREVIITDNSFGNAKVNFDLTNSLIDSLLKTKASLLVITGFIANTIDKETSTLGRGGSDYTASIIGAALNAQEIQIWTDVNGFMTADPRKVSKAIPIEALSYDEAMEMAHFGAKIIYPPTIRPAYIKSIPILIKNTFNPSFKGTLITTFGAYKNYLITGISVLNNVAIIKIEGSGLADVSNITGRIFSLLAKKGINLILVSQASSGQSIVFCIPAESARDVKIIIENEFEPEFHDSILESIAVDFNITVIAVIAENMKNISAIPGKIFQALGKNGVNIYAIAQGSSQLNLSLVVSRDDEEKALNVIHDEFFLSDYKTINLFIAGTGLIGRTLFQQIKNQLIFLYDELRLGIKIVGLTNTRKMFFSINGINIDFWEDTLNNEGVVSDIDVFISRMKKCNLSNSVFVDCTSSEIIIERYVDILSSSISIVTPNKKANSSTYDYYLQLRKIAKKFNVNFLYETNVGAGLPVINTLHDLILSGDKVIRIEGVLSGTLSYLFNNFNNDTSFSDLLIDAMEKGYTEPDPREDLNGLDVARKLLILCREAGYKIELEEIELENLVPEELRVDESIDEFLKKLKKYDVHFEERRQAANNNGKELRYIASYENGKASVKLQEVDSFHPFYSLTSNDNIISFKTVYYNQRPIVIQGPGAGATVTSGGVLADIVRIGNFA